MKLKDAETIEIPAWVGGLEKNTPPVLSEPGTLADGQNLVPTQASRLASRGGSRILQTLKNDAGSPVEVTGLCGIFPWTSIGGLVVGYDTAQHKSYAWYMTQDMAFKGATEAQSRVDLSLEPTGTVVHQSWKDTGGAPIPQVTELFEGLYLADATLSIGSRRYFMSLNQTVPTVQIGTAGPNAKVPRFAFASSGDSGTATAGTATTLTDSTKVWVVNQFAGYSVTIVGGLGKGETALITSNTATALTVPSWSIATPNTTSLYVITPGIAQEITPYCLETYNNVLFIAGYGSEAASDADRPEMLRHSFLGVAPSNSLALGDISDGFDKNAYNLIGAKGQRITGLKQGRGYLLVAKANELYRVSGAGRAYPGWQYAVEMVMNTSGMGVSNPNALTFAEGYWYGIGAAGPFRTDGFQVNTMVGPRKSDFNAVDFLANSFCFYHPDRRGVLFGVHPQGTTPAQYPWELWFWDVERERWQPDWVMGTLTALFHGNNIPTTSVSGASAPPNTPSTTNITTTGYTAHWVNGDATAQTEFWQLDTTSTWVLNSTQAAGINSVAVTGDLKHAAYQWKVRHVKNGLYSAYTSPLIVLTLMEPPILSDAGSPGHGPGEYLKIVNNNEDLVTIILNRNGVDGTPLLNQPKGTQILLETHGTYKAKAQDPAWTPTDSGYGASVVI